MSKTKKIIYWVSTLWLSLGMISTGVIQLMKNEDVILQMNKLGYPIYFLTIIGVWKFLGVIAVLIPKFPILKEWAYAGFFFLMTGAIISHIAVKDSAREYFGPTLLLLLILTSYFTRPDSRKVNLTL